MRLLRTPQIAAVLSFVALLSLSFGFAQSVPGSSVTATSGAAVPQPGEADHAVRAFPRIRLWGSEVLTYLGVFSPDATFHGTSRLTGATGYSPGEGIPPASSDDQSALHSDVPPSMLLSNERVVESLSPPAHAKAEARTPAPIGEIRNRFITYAYGRPSIVHAPRHVVADSYRRLIISDPDAEAVHVLDPAVRLRFAS